MLGNRVFRDLTNLGHLLGMVLVFGACQAPPVTLSGPLTMPSDDGESTISIQETLAADQGSEAPTSTIKKVIEWDATTGNFIMPPTEVRERIDENCRKIGYDRGVVVSMSVFESKVVADFDCRGGDAT
tara:strand:+ start:288 stop:671 length:384 start_codon:yes stop_codon:yes gene_type:complete